MAFLRATARGVLLANFSPPVSLLTYFFQASNIQFAMASSRCSRVFTSIFHPLAAASANGVMPVGSSLFVAEAPCCGSSSTISTSPFAMAWKRVVCLLFEPISTSFPTLRGNVGILFASLRNKMEILCCNVNRWVGWVEWEERKSKIDILIAICLSGR